MNDKHSKESEHPEENAPYNPLSPHADDPAYEPAPTHEEGHVGHGGEYDQEPYVEQKKDTEPDPDDRGEYDQKNFRDREAGRPGREDS